MMPELPPSGAYAASRCAWRHRELFRSGPGLTLERGARSILVPINFDVGDAKAVSYAAKVAGVMDLVVVLHHVLTVPVAIARHHHRGHRDLDDASDRMAGFLRESGLQGSLAEGLVRFRISLARGFPAAEIIAAAPRVGAGLIIMGCAGCGPDPPAREGSTAERVVRAAPCPVMVIPCNGAHDQLPRKGGMQYERFT